MKKEEFREWKIQHFRRELRRFRQEYGNAGYWEDWVLRLAQGGEWNNKYLTMDWRDKRDEVIKWAEDKLLENMSS